MIKLCNESRVAWIRAFNTNKEIMKHHLLSDQIYKLSCCDIFFRLSNCRGNDVEEQAQAMEENQDNEGPTAAGEQGIANTFNDSYPDTISTVSEAVRENKPDVLKQLIEEGTAVRGNDDWGWTALHYAAFLGHTECLRILLKEDTYEIDTRAAIDSSTPLMAACANLPTSKDCIKVLCEYKANPKATNGTGRTALSIAILIKPDLKVVKWLVRSGANVKDEKMMDLFKSRLGLAVKLPDEYLDEHLNEKVHLDVGETEVADIAMYLAKHGCVKNALSDLLLYNERIVSHQLLEVVMEYFLDNGAALKTHLYYDIYDHLFSPAVLSLFAQKSIIFLEWLPTSFEVDRHGLMEIEEDITEKFNKVTVMMIKGQARGTLPLLAVKETNDQLQSAIGDFLPTDFHALETLYAMTQNCPSLSQLARTEIRTQMAKCGKFCRENLKKLPLPGPLKDFVQLADLGDGSQFGEITKEAQETLENVRRYH